VDLQKINVKFFVSDPTQVALDSFIGVFNSWIQASEGEYYDLADYSHVPAGPGVVLVADEANVSIDNNETRLGLLYNRKRPLQGSEVEKLSTAVASALSYCRRIEEEPALEGKVRFRADEALIVINDRLTAPNDDKTLSAVRPVLEALGRRLFGTANVVIEKEKDARRRFAVRIRVAEPLTTEALIKNLQETVN
jgi:hypothetical protein